MFGGAGDQGYQDQNYQGGSSYVYPDDNAGSLAPGASLTFMVNNRANTGLAAESLLHGINSYARIFLTTSPEFAFELACYRAGPQHKPVRVCVPVICECEASTAPARPCFRLYTPTAKQGCVRGLGRVATARCPLGVASVSRW